MVKRDPQYRGVAEKIFVQLVSRFVGDATMQDFIKQHCVEAVSELDQVDYQIRTQTNTIPDMLLKSHSILSGGGAAGTAEKSQNTDNFEMQVHLHYLYKHLLLLARGGFLPAPEQSVAPSTGVSDLRFLGPHIIEAIQAKLREPPQDWQSPTLLSLLKKLQATEPTVGP